jgi:hypothetical protein
MKEVYVTPENVSNYSCIIRLPDKDISPCSLRLIFQDDLKVQDENELKLKQEKPVISLDDLHGHEVDSLHEVKLININAMIADPAILNLQKGEIRLVFTSMKYLKDYRIKAVYTNEHMLKAQEESKECCQIDLGCAIEYIEECVEELRAIEFLQHNSRNGFEYFKNRINLTARKNELWDIINDMTKELKERVR